MWQFSEAINGISEACTALETPITGGKRQLLQRNPRQIPIYPTPVLGASSDFLMEDADFAVFGSAFRDEGDLILLLDAGRDAATRDDQRRDGFSSSEYAKTIHGIVAGARHRRLIWPQRSG